MKDEAAKHQMEVILTAGEFDPAKQHHQVSDFITRRVDAIVLSPCDSKSIGAAIAEANKAGVPVFTVDSLHSLRSMSDRGKSRSFKA